ncbi:uncharacterized protein LOC119345251 [Triticum dicoccoides]|uniref:uncharacterized protein LOC119345251 n=1 Tax=Triticum dicoccoides TaxID=85692 RepID=UPI00188EB6AE|nr:uncharacterized protein LOC119345251 [Triticum dicoccoides]
MPGRSSSACSPATPGPSLVLMHSPPRTSLPPARDAIKVRFQLLFSPESPRSGCRFRLAAQGPWRVPFRAALPSPPPLPPGCVWCVAAANGAGKVRDTVGPCSPTCRRLLIVWDDLHEYTSRSKRIKYDILRAMAKLLELDEHCLVNQFSDRALTYARFKYYPPCPSFSEMERGTMFQLCLTTPC